MSFPSRSHESQLHERVLRGDPTVPVDVFQAFMPPILKVLQSELACDPEDAHDSAIDAVFSYLRTPERYEPQRARLSTYLTQAAKKRALDRRRSKEAQTRREQKFAGIFEVQARPPNEVLEKSVEARHAVQRLDSLGLDEREREFLRRVLLGERATRELAKVLGLDSRTEDEQRREVKRHRDRLMKMLERLGKKEDPDDQS